MSRGVAFTALCAVVSTGCYDLDALRPPDSAIRWHPGAYVLASYVTEPGSDKIAERRSELVDAFARSPHIVGTVQTYSWASLEGARDDYSAGFALVDSD